MASLQEAVVWNMADGQSHGCTVDGHDFKVESIGRSRVPGSAPRQIKVFGKIVHDYQWPQADDDVFFTLLVTQDQRAVVEALRVEGGTWSFDDIIAAARGLPGIIFGGPSGTVGVIVLNAAMPAPDDWKGAMVKVVQCVGQEVWKEYFG